MHSLVFYSPLIFVFSVAYFIDIVCCFKFMVVITVVCCQIRVWIWVSCVQSLKIHWVNDVAVFAVDLQ
jgi:hypothetical protein